MFFCLVQVSLLPISLTAIKLSSENFVETSNQTATQRPVVSLENTPVEVIEEKEKDEGEARQWNFTGRATTMLACSATGEKLKQLVIGKAQKTSLF